jgi:hypothetical protein
VHRERGHGRLPPCVVAHPTWLGNAQPGGRNADTTRMDDSFAYRTTLPPEPRVEPWVVKGAVVGALFVLAIALFTRWVVTSERESFARGSHAVMTSMRVGQIEGTADRLGTDDDAEEATRIALTAARAAFVQSGSFLAADPARLSALQPGFTFVDGPSTMPEVVSVAADRHSWAAAALGPTGTCFWIRDDVTGTISTGTAPGSTSTCTGRSFVAGDDLSTSSLDPRRSR